MADTYIAAGQKTRGIGEEVYTTGGLVLIAVVADWSFTCGSVDVVVVED